MRIGRDIGADVQQREGHDPGDLAAPLREAAKPGNQPYDRKQGPGQHQRMAQGERSKTTRLSAVLQRSPDRLARLIREGDDALLGDLAHLLPRLGTPAVRAAPRCSVTR